MIIFPDIEIMDGQCVNLRHGEFEQPVRYDISPMQAALNFIAQGATYLNIVDLDGVLQGGKYNADIICEIIGKVDVPVQVAGGIRTMAAAKWWIDNGAHRIVLGTAAVMDRHFLQEVCAHYPGKVVASIDEKDGQVMVNGWRESTAFTPLEVGHNLQESGICALIYTDINRDGMKQSPNFKETAKVADTSNCPVIISGGVSSIDDIKKAKELNNNNIEGIIVGKAIYDGDIKLDELVKELDA